MMYDVDVGCADIYEDESGLIENGRSNGQTDRLHSLLFDFSFRILCLCIAKCKPSSRLTLYTAKMSVDFTVK